MGPGNLKSGGATGVLLGTAAMALALLHAFIDPPSTDSMAAASASTAQIPSVLDIPTADFGNAKPTADVRWLVDWIAETGDNGSSAFIVVDKRAAAVHVFNSEARWTASSPVLLGVALGDDSVPGIGSRPMGLIEAHERTTPAGRFIGERGRNAAGEDVVWVDYDAAVSMHRVRLTKPIERRADRLSSPSVEDNRISYGCINVPVAFYDLFVQPVFARQHANVYVLPDVKSVQQVFGAAFAASTPKSTSVALVSPGSDFPVMPPDEIPLPLR